MFALLALFMVNSVVLLLLLRSVIWAYMLVVSLVSVLCYGVYCLFGLLVVWVFGLVVLLLLFVLVIWLT